MVQGGRTAATERHFALKLTASRFAMTTGAQDSALIVNVYRARRPRESGDLYADLWLTPACERWADQYAVQVGHSEVLVHALRHHYFLGKIRITSRRYAHLCDKSLAQAVEQHLRDFGQGTIPQRPAS